MKVWFQTKVKFQKQDEQGRMKNVTETHLVDALSFTEAEAKIYEEISQRVMGEFMVADIKRTKIVDVYEYADADTFYQAKVTYMVADADSGKEKKVTNLIIVGATNIGQAYERINESLSRMLVYYKVVEVKESLVKEVFHHVADQVSDNATPVLEAVEPPVEAAMHTIPASFYKAAADMQPSPPG